MDIKIIGAVKHNGEWVVPGTVLEGFDEKEAQRLINIGVALEIGEDGQVIQNQINEQRRSKLQGFVR